MRARRPRCGADADCERERDGAGGGARAEEGGGSGDGRVEVVVKVRGVVMGERGGGRGGVGGVETGGELGRIGMWGWLEVAVMETRWEELSVDEMGGTLLCGCCDTAAIMLLRNSIVRGKEAPLVAVPVLDMEDHCHWKSLNILRRPV